MFLVTHCLTSKAPKHTASANAEDAALLILLLPTSALPLQPADVAIWLVVTASRGALNRRVMLLKMDKAIPTPASGTAPGQKEYQIETLRCRHSKELSVVHIQAF